MQAWEDFKKTKFGTFCTDPAVGFIIGILAIIIGFSTSYYFYRLSVRERQLSYYVNPNITTVVQSNMPSALAVTYQGQPITNGFYGVQIAVWNEGKESIEEKDVLQQVAIVPPPGVHILQWSIAKKSRDLTEFKMATNATVELITLSWKILEFRDGGVVQLFYTGTSKDTFTVHGALRDQPKVRELQVAISKGRVGLGFMFIMLSCAFSTLVSYVMSRKALRAIDSGTDKIRVKILSLAVTLVMIITILYVVHVVVNYVMQRPVPFGM